MSLPVLADIRIGIIGLGYIGLPLAVYLARHFPVIGFDIDRLRRRRRGLRSDADIPLAKHESGVTFTNDRPQGPFDAIILAVKHESIAKLGEASINSLLASGGLIY